MLHGVLYVEAHSNGFIEKVSSVEQRMVFVERVEQADYRWAGSLGTGHGQLKNIDPVFLASNGKA